MESKKKKASFSDIMTHLITGLLMSFGSATEKKQEPNPEPKKDTIVQNSSTYIIIYKERERKGILKWLVGLFW
jgi:hypothetical protein